MSQPHYRLRFWRRIRIAPGVRLNLRWGWPSISVGPREYHVTFGRRGRRTTTIEPLPGSGIYLTKQWWSRGRRGHHGFLLVAGLAAGFGMAHTPWWLLGWGMLVAVVAGIMWSMSRQVGEEEAR